ncbi:Inner membrane transport protein YnfM [compost metagenome]
MARGYKALAASLYLLVYYVGSSVLGSLGGHFWTVGQWQGVAAMAGGSLALALVISTGLAWRTSGSRRAQAPAARAQGNTAVRGG